MTDSELTKLVSEFDEFRSDTRRRLKSLEEGVPVLDEHGDRLDDIDTDLDELRRELKSHALWRERIEQGQVQQLGEMRSLRMDLGRVIDIVSADRLQANKRDATLEQLNATLMRLVTGHELVVVAP